MTADPTDAQLVARALEAREAFVALYERHAPPVFAFLRAMHRGDEHAAADSLQETFFRAYSALPRFDQQRPLRPWLLSIATNVALDALERRARADAREQRAAAPERADDPATTVAALDACTRLLERAAARLPARKLATFVLARGQGLTYEEVAAVHGCSTVTVKRDLADALRALAGAATELGLT